METKEYCAPLEHHRHLRSLAQDLLSAASEVGIAQTYHT